MTTTQRILKCSKCNWQQVLYDADWEPEYCPNCSAGKLHISIEHEDVPESGDTWRERLPDRDLA